MLPGDGSLPSEFFLGPQLRELLVFGAVARPCQGRRAQMVVIHVIFMSDLGCALMMKKIMMIRMMMMIMIIINIRLCDDDDVEEEEGENNEDQVTYRGCPDALQKIGVARKCFTTTRALGVASGVVDRAAQQSENIQQEKRKNEN